MQCYFSVSTRSPGSGSGRVRVACNWPVPDDSTMPRVVPMASTSRSRPTRRPAVKARKAVLAGKGPAKAAGRAKAKIKAKGKATTKVKMAAKPVTRASAARTATRRGAVVRKPARSSTVRKVAAKKAVAPARKRAVAGKPMVKAAGRTARRPAAIAHKPAATSRKPAAAARKQASVERKPAKTAKRVAPAPHAPAPRASAPRAPAPRIRVETPRPVEAKPTVDQVAREKELAREHAVTAVSRALSLLETLARTGPVPLAVLADAAGCGKNAAAELLTTMQSRSFVIQDESNNLWRLGARWAVLGSAASEQGALAATAMPYLAALGNQTGENVYLRVREGMESETVAIYQTDPGLRVYTEVGKKMPLHAGSGRLLLAHAPEAVQTQVLAQRLQHYTPSTRTDPSWIAADLHRIRQRGFLITDSEVVAGTVSVCAPVRDASGQVVASILIGSPSLRMRPPRPRALMPIVVEAARKLSHALGSTTEQPATATPPNGPIDGPPLGAFSGPAWPATAALGAAISRPP